MQKKQKKTKQAKTLFSSDKQLRPLRADASDDLEEIIYKRKDEVAFTILASNITEMVSTGASYALLWQLPTEADPRGNLTSLYFTRITFENVSPYTLHVSLAKPYGFKTDPLGIAYWEAQWGNSFTKTIAPHKTASAIIHHSADPHKLNIGPRHVVTDGLDHLHTCSFYVKKNHVADSGEDIDDKDQKVTVALNVKAATSYESSGSGTGTSKSYTVRKYNSEKHMQSVNYPPSLPVSLGQLRGSGGQIQTAELVSPDDLSGVKRITKWMIPRLQFSADRPYPGDNQIIRPKDLHAEGLDKDTVYTLQYPFYGVVGVVWYSASWGKHDDVGKIGTFELPDVKTPMDITYYSPLTFLRYRKNFTIKLNGVNEVIEEGWYLHGTGESIGSIDTVGKFINTSTNWGIPLNQDVLLTPDKDQQVTTAVDYWKNVKIKKAVPGMCRTDVKTVARRELYEADFFDKVLSAISVIISVAKTVVTVASILGLAEENVVGDANDEDQEEAAGYVLCDA